MGWFPGGPGMSRVSEDQHRLAQDDLQPQVNREAEIARELPVIHLRALEEQSHGGRGGAVLS
jgi:hypothetical protein